MKSVVVESIARALFAPSLVIAVAILVKGYSDVGDGFTAGIVAALAVLLQYVAIGYRRVEQALPVRHALTVGLAGLLLTLVVTFAPVAWGDAPLTHYPGPGEHVIHIGTLELLTAVLFDVGVFLLVLGGAVAAVDAVARAERSRS